MVTYDIKIAKVKEKNNKYQILTLKCYIIKIHGYQHTTIKTAHTCGVPPEAKLNNSPSHALWKLNKFGRVQVSSEVIG